MMHIGMMHIGIIYIQAGRQKNEGSPTDERRITFEVWIRKDRRLAHLVRPHVQRRDVTLRSVLQYISRESTII